MALRPNFTDEELKRHLAKQKQLLAQKDPMIFRLVAFLKLVWEQTKGGTLPTSPETIYNLYNGKLPPKPVTEDAPPTQPFEVLKADFIGKAQAKSKLKDCNGDLAIPDGAFVVEKGSNLEFRTPCLNDLLEITDRVYINVKMAHALDVMRFIVDNLVLLERGVVQAKIAYPLTLCLPVFDRIVVYCHTKEVAKRVADGVSARFSEDCFNRDTPAMTKVLAKGISTGSEPRKAKMRDKDESFGTKRAHIVWQALKDCGQDETKFLEAVFEKFTANNIDPNKPHRNIPEKAH